MRVQHIAAFSSEAKGGNPAGVVLLDALPEEAAMQAVAAEVGYSETVFAAETERGHRVRYFAPQGEVAFCGHATIALGAALGAKHGAGRFDLQLNDSAILVDAAENQNGWGAKLRSPNTRYRAAESGLITASLALFGLSPGDLEPGLGIVRANAGAEHAIIPLASHQMLQDMVYDFAAGAKLMQAFGLVTFNLIWRQSPDVIHSRNPFAGHGVYEDPATGAAAAALGGYLRDAEISATPFLVHQGVDMGVPSRLMVEPLPGLGAPIAVGGETRNMQV